MKLKFLPFLFFLLFSLSAAPPSEAVEPFGKIIKQVSSEIFYANVGRDQGLFEGAVLDVIIPGEEIVDPGSGEVFRMDPEKIGKVKVIKILGASISQVSVVETKPGYRVEVLYELQYTLSQQKALDVRRIKTIAILPLQSNVNTAYVNINVGSVVSNVIGDYIAKFSNGIQVVEKDETTMNAIMQQYELELAGIVSSDKSRELGNILGADAFVTGSITGFPGDMATLMSGKSFVAFSAKMVDLRTAKVIYSDSSDGASKTVSREEAAAQAQMAQSLLGYAGIPMLGDFAGSAIQSQAAAQRKTPTELTTLAVKRSAMDWAAALVFKMEGDPVKAYKFRKLALDDLEANNIPSATRNIDTALQESPNDPLALRIRGEVLLANSDNSGAVAAYRKAVEESDKKVWVLNAKTGELARNKEGEYVMTELTTFEKTVISIGYAEALIRNNDFDIAEQTLYSVMTTLSSSATKDKEAFAYEGKYDKGAIEKSTTRAATLLATAEIIEGEYGPALAALKEIKRPDSFAYRTMSECYFKMANYKDAIAYGKKALQGKDPSWDAYEFVIRSSLQMDKQDFKSALKSGEDWIKKSGTQQSKDVFAEISLQCAEEQLAKGQKSSAKSTLKKAIDYKPSSRFLDALQSAYDGI